MKSFVSITTNTTTLMRPAVVTLLLLSSSLVLLFPPIIAAKTDDSSTSTCSSSSESSSSESQSPPDVSPSSCTQQDGPTTTATSASRHDSPQQQQQQQECTLFIAPSTIPYAGLGVFTTVPLKVGHVLDGDVILPILPIDSATRRGYSRPFANFVWDAPTLGMTLETSTATGEEEDDVNGMCPGLDALTNCHLALTNIRRGVLDYDDDDQLLQLNHDDNGGGPLSPPPPSIGSMTPYNNARSVVSYHIEAGGELFKSYGDDWFVDRVKTFGNVPLRRDYVQAERLVTRLHKTLRVLNTASAKRALYEIMTSLQQEFDSRILNALPQDYIHFERTIAKGDMANGRSSSFMRTWHGQNATRPIADLYETGRCASAIRQGQSTLSHAGRGAFATRSFSKGDIVTGSPLVHVPTLDMAKIRQSSSESNGEDVTTTMTTTPTTTRYHLWVNYCMGHRQGHLLLFPYGMGVNYINHNQTLANIQLRWTPNGTLSQNDTWFNMSQWPREQVKHTHLAMDYVALRDIREGEELFLDYGNEWEQAWQSHVSNWRPSDEEKTYLSARQWNKRHVHNKLRTTQEQETRPYPSNLLLRCHPIMNRKGWRKITRQQRVWPPNDVGWPCAVINRTVVSTNDTAISYLYDVELVDEDDNDTILPRQGVPRHLMKMADAPYSTSWHNRRAFRHWIGIPDDMFPQAWRTNGTT